MEKISKTMMTKLIAELRKLAPNRPLSYGESIQVARLQAAKLRALLGIDTPEINLMWLIQQAVVPVRFVPSHELNEDSGLTTDLIDGQLQIFINEAEPAIRQRFSVLHELKHVLDFPHAKTLHGRLSSGDAALKGNMIEWIANDFAAHVLMPTPLVKRVWHKTQDVTLSASFFNVSREAMTTRLTKLGLIGEARQLPRMYFRANGLLPTIDVNADLSGCLAYAAKEEPNMSKRTNIASVDDTQTAVKTAVLYLRVSSKRQMDTAADIDPEGNSIDTQRKICRDKARHMGVVIVGEYVEPGNSAQTIAKRPVFQDMMKRIKEERDVDHVIIYQRSRAFRNYIDAGNTKVELEKIGVSLVSAKEDFGKGLNAEVMEAMTDVFNWWTVRQGGEDIKLKMANKVRNGGTPSRAKVGYLNVGKNIDGRKINTIDVDPERGRFITMAFELFATGEESLDSLRDKLTAAGFRMPKWGKATTGIISEEKLRNLLRDRYYLGFVQLDGIEYPGNHTPLVTPELFDRVQRVLAVRGENHVRHREHNHYLTRAQSLPQRSAVVSPLQEPATRPARTRQARRGVLLLLLPGPTAQGLRHAVHPA